MFSDGRCLVCSTAVEDEAHLPEYHLAIASTLMKICKASATRSPQSYWTAIGKLPAGLRGRFSQLVRRRLARGEPDFEELLHDAVEGGVSSDDDSVHAHRLAATLERSQRSLRPSTLRKRTATPMSGDVHRRVRKRPAAAMPAAAATDSQRIVTQALIRVAAESEAGAAPVSARQALPATHARNPGRPVSDAARLYANDLEPSDSESSCAVFAIQGQLQQHRDERHGAVAGQAHLQHAALGGDVVNAVGAFLGVPWRFPEP